MLKYVKHLLIILGLLSLPILLFSGCLKEGNDTIVLPLPDGKIPYSVIPEQLQDSLRTHGLTIHEGVNPGNIDGRFLSSPMVLHYSSDNYQDIDGKSYMANVIGEGNDVTMYCLQNVFECSSSGDTLWKSRTATVVSGTLCDEGIKYCQYAHVVLDTWAADDYHASPLSKPGTHRIWYDGDGLAKRLSDLSN